MRPHKGPYGHRLRTRELSDALEYGDPADDSSPSSSGSHAVQQNAFILRGAAQSWQPRLQMLQPFSVNSKVRLRSKSGSSANLQRGRRPSALSCGAWVMLLLACLLCLATLALVNRPPLKVSLSRWKREEPHRIGRTMLSTLTSYFASSNGRPTTTPDSSLHRLTAHAEGSLYPFMEDSAVMSRGGRRRKASSPLLDLLRRPLGLKARGEDTSKDSNFEADEELTQLASQGSRLNISLVKERRPKTIQPPIEPLSPLQEQENQETDDPRLALCLIGGARDFQLTGPTIREHLLRAYPKGDVFVLSPLDDNSHKLSLLITLVPNLVLLRIAPDVPVNESVLTDRLLAAIRGGPDTPEAQTRQGIIQQFKSVEMCASVISAYERQHAFKYEWILRTRIDGYWMGPPPPLRVLDPKGYTIPGGSDWGGLNDRLGVGKHDISMMALRRLSAMNALVLRGHFENLNAERVYRAHMAFMGLEVVRYDFPFCILSRKKGMPAFPVAAALSSTAALNGAKCRPCRPSLTGAGAAKYVANLPEKVFGSLPYGIDLCLAESHWESDWERIFDRQAGREKARIRRYLDARTFQECVRDWEQLRPLVRIWDAPPPEPLCVRERLGKFRKLGFPGGEFPVFIDPFLPPRVSSRTRNPIVYSVVTGVDYSFDWALLRKLKGIFVRVHAFDSTPQGLRWVSEKFDNLPSESWIHHPWLIGPEDKPLQLYELELDEHPVEYATRLPDGMEPTSVPPPITVEAHSLEFTMSVLNHSWIDILRIGDHPSLHEDIFASWIKQKSTPPICQVIVSFHRGEKHYGSQDRKTRRELLALRALGYELAACLRKDAYYESCVFFSVDACEYDF